jgi:hypothetical protein
VFDELDKDVSITLLAAVTIVLQSCCCCCCCCFNSYFDSFEIQSILAKEADNDFVLAVASTRIS